MTMMGLLRSRLSSVLVPSFVALGQLPLPVSPQQVFTPSVLTRPVLTGYSSNDQDVELSESFATMVPQLAPGAAQPVSYSVTVRAAPYTGIPAGLFLNSATGRITKTSTPRVGPWIARIRATNALGYSEIDVLGTFRRDRVDFGINLNHVVHYGRTLEFANLFARSEPWRNGTSGNVPCIDDPTSPAHGYPDFSRIPAGTTITARVFSSATDTFDLRTSPAGTYRIEWDGRGTVTTNLSGTVQSGPGWMQWPDQQPAGLEVRITDGDRPDQDPVRNIRVYPPNVELDPSGLTPYTSAYKFRTGAIDKLEEAVHVGDAAKGCIRFLDWCNVNDTGRAGTNNAGHETGWYVRDGFDRSRVWETSVRQTEKVDHTTPPVAFEHMLDLANAVGCDAWINVPHQEPDPDVGPAGTDYRAFCEGLADLILARLDPALDVYIEWSNEVWNQGFRVNHWIANETGASVRHPRNHVIDPAFVPFQAERMLEMFAPIKARFLAAGELDRLRFVVMGRTQTPSYLAAVLAALDGRELPAPLAGTTFDVERDVYGGGCSWYIRSTDDDAWTSNTTKFQMAIELQAYIDGGLRTNLEAHRVLLKDTYRGRKFLCYEGGLSTPVVRAAWAPRWFALHKSAAAYGLYRNAFAVLRDEEVDLALHYGFLNKLDDSLGGVWQLIENESQRAGGTPGQGPYDASHPELSPKYDAWIEGPAPTW